MEPVGGGVLQKPAQGALAQHGGQFAGHDLLRRRAGARQVIGGELAGAAAEAEGQLDAARGERRDHAGGVADEHDVVIGEGAHDAAAGDDAGAALDDPFLVQFEQRGELLAEGGHVRPVAVIGGQAHLNDIRGGRGPADVSRRQAGVEKAVQEVFVQPGNGGELLLHADEQPPVAAKAEGLRHGGARPVRADEKARGDAMITDDQAPLFAPGAGEAGRTADFGSGAAGLAGQPAHEAGHVRGEEVIARRGQIGVFEVRRVEAHRRYRAHEAGGHVALLGGFLDQDAGGVDARAGIALGLQHQHLQPAQGGGAGAGQAGETGPDDDEIIILAGAHDASPGASAASGGLSGRGVMRIFVRRFFSRPSTSKRKP